MIDVTYIFGVDGHEEEYVFEPSHDQVVEAIADDLLHKTYADIREFRQLPEAAQKAVKKALAVAAEEIYWEYGNEDLRDICREYFVDVAYAEWRDACAA